MGTRAQGVDDEALVRATGRDWSSWESFLHNDGASDLDHTAIARRLHEVHGVPGWWSQHLTVRFEQAIGRRAPGQRCTGDFAVSATATRAGDMDGLLEAWRAAHDGDSDFDGVLLEAPPSHSATPRWRYWRAALTDGGRVTVMFSEKAPGKIAIAVNHEKLDSPDAVERWRGWWKSVLSGFAV
ncbi:hypothetical protein ACO2Q1_11270 [Brevundimonas sp. VNH65]|uniref:hypothetical protein n=1 Tax=Brevundimonas sp. VNH65 TaxID=3400917 RepID=UPI003C081BF4